MVREVSYEPCPTSSSTEGLEKRGEKRGRSRLWKWLQWVLWVILAILSVLFFGLYMGQVHSEPAAQLRACQAQLQNQTAQAQAQEVAASKKCKEELKRAEAQATKVVTTLRNQLVDTNRSLGEAQLGQDACQKARTREVAASKMYKEELERADNRTTEVETTLRNQLVATNRSLCKVQQDRDACQKALNTLKENITSCGKESDQLEKDKSNLQDEIKNLLKKVSNLSEQLKAAQNSSQKERQQNEDRIKHLQEQLDNAQKPRSRSISCDLSQDLFLLILTGYLHHCL